MSIKLMKDIASWEKPLRCTILRLCVTNGKLPVTRLDAETVAGCTVGLFELLGVAAADLAPSLDGAVPVQAHTSARRPEVMQLLGRAAQTHAATSASSGAQPKPTQQLGVKHNDKVCISASPNHNGVIIHN